MCILHFMMSNVYSGPELLSAELRAASAGGGDAEPFCASLSAGDATGVGDRDTSFL